MNPWIRRAGMGAALAFTAGACDAILAIPDRTLDPNLTCDTGACKCAEGFKSCDGNDANGCEADLQNDPTNCGSCGRDCLGGPCAGGLCQPVMLVDEDDLGDLAVVGGYVYYTSLGNAPIRRVPVRGGDPQPVAGTSYGSILRVVDGTLYWGDFYQVLAAPVDGSAQARVIADDVYPILEMGVGGGMIYWLNYDEMLGYPSLMRAPTAGGPIEVLTPQTEEDGTWSVTADETAVYYGVLGAVLRIPHAGTEPALVATTFGYPNAIKESAGSLYWFDEDVYRMPLGGAPLLLAEADFDGGLAIDTEHVFFTTLDLRVRKVPLLGGEVEVLAQEQNLNFAFGYHLVVDNEAAYWISEEGLFRVAK